MAIKQVKNVAYIPSSKLGDWGYHGLTAALYIAVIDYQLHDRWAIGFSEIRFPSQAFS